MQRALGRSGITASAIGMGCWAIGGPFYHGETPAGWGDVDDAESERAILAALDLGITLFDTADVYGAGHSERVLGRVLKGRRSEVVLATKFSNVFDEKTKQVTGSDASPDHIRSACEASLSRLGTDFIDLYQFHNGGYPLDQVADVIGALEGLVEAGKIRAYGWSTDDPDRARAFANGEHCAAAQFQMNIISDAPEMVAVCEELNLAGLNRGPLAMGLLTGKYNADSVLPANDVRGPNAPEWMSFFKDGKPSPELLTRLAAVREILTSGGRSLVQGALAWLLARSPVTLPIPGFKSVAQVTENAGALAYGPLKEAEMAQIRNLLQS
jgi:aryl-alcohol dehydrogenase-like predicted oxidoreductase